MNNRRSNHHGKSQKKVAHLVNKLKIRKIAQTNSAKTAKNNEVTVLSPRKLKKSISPPEVNFYSFG